jgi:leucyl aminopeptidase
MAIGSIISLPHKQIPLFTDTKELRLISTADDEPSQWMNEDQIFELYRKHIKFIDVTEEFSKLSSDSFPLLSQKVFPTKPGFKNIVDPILEHVSVDEMEQFLTEYSTTFHTRYYKSLEGAKASKWLYNQVTGLGNLVAAGIKFEVNEFKHSWGQSSIIARVEGSLSPKKDCVILSAHLDSVNQYNPWFGRAPGADDNGSGTTTIFEALRALLKSGFIPERPIEFHFYSAEEAGLLGSQQVAHQYSIEKRQVYAVYHNDMTGYLSEDGKEQIGVVTDYVSGKLNPTLEMIIDAYSGISWVHTKCTI